MLKTVPAYKRRSVPAKTCSRLNASTLLRLSILSFYFGCASTGDPPGGPADVTPPNVSAFAPESGSILTVPPAEASITFDEVVSERTTGQPADISGAVILSPTAEAVRVSFLMVAAWSSAG